MIASRNDSVSSISSAAGAGSFAATWASARPNSWALERSVASGRAAFSIGAAIAPRSAETGNSFPARLARVTAGESAAKGTSPVSVSSTVRASAYMSLAAVGAGSCASSGAAYLDCSTLIDAIPEMPRLMPMPASRARESGVTNTFAGLMSPCANPLVCRCTSARHKSSASTMACDGLKRRERSSNSRSEVPASRSVTTNTWRCPTIVVSPQSSGDTSTGCALPDTASRWRLNCSTSSSVDSGPISTRRTTT